MIGRAFRAQQRSLLSQPVRILRPTSHRMPAFRQRRHFYAPPKEPAEQSPQPPGTDVADQKEEASSERQASGKKPEFEGGISWKLVGGLVVVGTVAIGLSQWMVKRNNTTKAVMTTAGTPKIGGPFQLTDCHNNPRTDKDYLGEYILLYFGFTKCPDICPTELAKVVKALDEYKDSKLPTVRPVFVTVDPERDTPAALKEYSTKFPSNMHWLTGPIAKIDEAAKAYRVYYYIPTLDERQGDNDYLVDHSIFFYLIGPNGKIIDYFGKNWKAHEMAEKMRVAVAKYELDLKTEK